MSVNSFVNTHAWNDFGFALLAPLAHLGVDLVAELRFDLTGVACVSRCTTYIPAKSARNP